MKVIATTDLSRPGNDVYIHESISLIEQFEIYSIISCRKVTGWTNVESVEVLFSSNDCGKVIEKYDSLGGKI